MINESFRYIFSNIIEYINAICYISKSTSNRLDILTKYIFSTVASLFSEDISENFIFLATFANKDTLIDGPDFINSIQIDVDFLNIQKRGKDEKWWFAFDSKSVLDNEEDKLTIYSFSQLNEFYEEKVKRLKPKSIKKGSEVLATRLKLTTQLNLMEDTFQNLLRELSNLLEREKNINIINNKINDLEKKIKNFESESKNLNSDQIEQKIKDLIIALNDKLNTLNSETTVEYTNSLEYNNKYVYTHCNSCERNCHDYCDCYGNILDRCKVFKSGIFKDKRCEECGCSKEKHIFDHYHWIKKRVEKDNDKQIKEEREKKKKKYLEEQTKGKSNLDILIIELNYNKNIINEEQKKYIKEQTEIQEKIKNTNSQICFVLIKLQQQETKIEDILKNNRHIKNEDEFIDSLKDKVEEIGLNDEEQKKVIQIMKENMKIFKEKNNIKEEELINLNDDQLAEKLGIEIPKLKKSN